MPRSSQYWKSGWSTPTVSLLLPLSGFLESRLVVIGKSRPLGDFRRVLLQFRQHHLDRLLQLWVMAFTHRLGIELHFNVRRHAAVLHVPAAIGEPDPHARSGH